MHRNTGRVYAFFLGTHIGTAVRYARLPNATDVLGVDHLYLLLHRAALLGGAGGSGNGGAVRQANRTIVGPDGNVALLRYHQHGGGHPD